MNIDDLPVVERLASASKHAREAQDRCYAAEDKLADLERKRVRELGWPSPLEKAANDPFCYFALLKDGTKILFDSAKAIDAEWVKLEGLSGIEESFNHLENTRLLNHAAPFYRGVSVRFSEIVIISDNPFEY